MSLRRKTLIIAGISAAGLLAALHTISPRKTDDQWGVLVGGLPDKVYAKNAVQSLPYYILKQTHEPILRRDDGQNYYSNILRKWRRDLNSSEYEFCLKPGLRFNAGNVFYLPEFFVHLKAVTQKYDPSAALEERSGCVLVRFSRGRKGYLDFLALYENSPTVRRTEFVEDGLGPFFIESLSKEKVVLERKKLTSGGYNKIVLYDYKGRGDPNLENRGIKDFNMIPIYDVPQWVISDYFSFDNAELKSINLIINHPDPEVRKAVYNCVDVDKLRRSFFPIKKDFYDIQTILPVGMPGAKGGLPPQKCEPSGIGGRLKEPLIFANWGSENEEQLRGLMRDIRVRTGMNIRVAPIKPEEVGKILFSSPRPYNMIIVVVDAVRSGDAAFFDPFGGETTCFDFEIKNLKAHYKKLLYEEGEQEKQAAAQRISDDLTDQFALLTLYQNVKKLYYPKEIKHLNIGKGFLQYPEVATLQI